METDDSIQSWERYPEGLEAHEPFFTSWIGQLQRLATNSEAIFSESKTLKVKVIRKSADKQTNMDPLVVLYDEEQLDECLKKSSNDKFRIVSFFQGFSLDTLKCSHSAMMNTLWYCEVSPMFLDVLLKFGDQEQIFEESSGFRQTFQKTDGSFNLCYQLMYVEPSGKPAGRDKFSIRQTGAYHRWDASIDGNLFLLLHPRHSPPVQERLESLAREPQQKFSLTEHPMNVHIVLLTCCLTFWEAYLEDLAKGLSEYRSKTLVQSAHFKPDELQCLRNLEDKVASRALSGLKSTIVLVQTLLRLTEGLPRNDPAFHERSYHVKGQLRVILQRLEAHVNAAEMLAQKIEATLGLLANLLDLQSKEASDQINKHMLQLTRESVDDNATVKVITVCTLIYLPASFTATLLGMNLFEFESTNGSLKVSPVFWIYFAATIPLTALTIGAWYIFKVRSGKRRQIARRMESPC